MLPTAAGKPAKSAKLSGRSTSPRAIERRKYVYFALSRLSRLTRKSGFRTDYHNGTAVWVFRNYQFFQRHLLTFHTLPI